MQELIERFVPQVYEALEIGQKATIHPHSSEIQNVFISGMGGSGIGANFVQDFVRDVAKVPVMVGKGYSIPSWINVNTLAIVSSYSGNTEETLACFEQLLHTGAKIVAVSSGGKIIELAKQHNLDHIILPGGWPSPRACLGFSFTQQMCILNKLDIIPDELIHQIRSGNQLLESDSDNIQEKARHIAQILQDKIPVIYTTDRMEAVAIRFRQQVNENAKMLCWHHVIPEMNHNELVGWRNPYQQMGVIVFRNRDDVPRNAARIDINKTIITEYTNTWIEIYSKGNSLIEKSMYLVHLGDWISMHLSIFRNVDPDEIKVIDYLKEELSHLGA